MKLKKIDKNQERTPVIIESGGRLVNYFLNLCVFAGLPYFLSKYDKNPSLMIVLIGVLITILLFNCIEYFYVGEKELVICYKKIFFLQFLNRKRIFKYEDIKNITVTLKHNKRSEIASFIFNLTNKIKIDSSNEFEIEMKSGKKRYLNTEIYKDKLMPIIEFIRSKGVEIKTLYPSKKI